MVLLISAFNFSVLCIIVYIYILFDSLRMLVLVTGSAIISVVFKGSLLRELMKMITGKQ